FNKAGQAAEGMLWLIVEKSDLYALVIINIVLLGVLFYLRGMFKEFMSLIQPKKEKLVSQKAMRKFNKVLTDAVPIEQEQSILMHHEYDGIRELDNNLPPWWVWMFYATIIFSVVYVVN